MPPPEFAASLRELLEHWQIKEGIRAELTNLIRIQGEVVENGTRRPFKKAEDLETISSHGLSYIVLVLIFIGFINRVRGTAPVNVVWALDEIKDLDVGNVELLMEILARNNITLVSACPDPDPDVLALFKNRCSIRADRCIYDTAGAADDNAEDRTLGEEGATSGEALPISHYSASYNSAYVLSMMPEGSSEQKGAPVVRFDIVWTQSGPLLSRYPNSGFSSRADDL